MSRLRILRRQALVEIGWTIRILTEQPASILTPGVQMDQAEKRRSDVTNLDEQRDDRGLMDYRSHTDDDSCFGMETDIGSLARSTLAQALYCPAKNNSFTCPDDSSNESSVPTVPVGEGPVPLSGSSRAIIKHCLLKQILFALILAILQLPSIRTKSAASCESLQMKVSGRLLKC